MAHRCHATACRLVVPRERLMCPVHWRLVPAELQAGVWATYRDGQCADMNPSQAYLEAAKAAGIAVAQHECINPDTTLYDRFIWRKPVELEG